jgi:hypothetical protein
VTDTNAFDESSSDDDVHVVIDKGNGNTDSELDLDTTLSSLAEIYLGIYMDFRSLT